MHAGGLLDTDLAEASARKLALGVLVCTVPAITSLLPEIGCRCNVDSTCFHAGQAGKEVHVCVGATRIAASLKELVYAS